ncbi:MAG: YtxH domain-containing protein [Bacteroidia bacterium]
MSDTETQNTGNTGKVFGALLVGAIVGAGLGMLFAPEPGSETQKKVIDELKEALNSLKDKIVSHHCPGCTCKKEEEPAKHA